LAGDAFKAMRGNFIIGRTPASAYVLNASDPDYHC
jgi:hypothetical protein